jgi:hypothetical protein
MVNLNGICLARKVAFNTWSSMVGGFRQEGNLLEASARMNVINKNSF